MASGTAPSPLYFINSNTHICTDMLFPECPTAVLSSGLQLDGTFYGCFYNVGGILHFSKNTRDVFFSPYLKQMELFTVNSTAKNPPNANRGSQTSTQPHTESLKPTFEVVSRHLIAHLIMLQNLAVSAKERNLKKATLQADFSILFIGSEHWDSKKEKKTKNCKALLWRQNKSSLHFLMFQFHIKLIWVCPIHFRLYSWVHLHRFWYPACLSPQTRQPLEHHSSCRFCLTCRTGWRTKASFFNRTECGFGLVAQSPAQYWDCLLMWAPDKFTAC